MKSRRSERIYGIKNITILSNSREYSAIVTNISKQGICVKSEHPLPTYKVVDVILLLENKEIKITGSVRWVNERVRKGKPNMMEIGISLLNPPSEYTEYLKEIPKESPEEK